MDEIAIFTTAIVRPPGPGFANGITEAKLGSPDLALALNQHVAYCRALERCGLTLHSLRAEPEFPDSTFVEDTALLLNGRAILTRPGPESRRGEVELIRDSVSRYFDSVTCIEPPGTLDAGDVCEAGDTLFVGLSHRTNQEGIRQLSEKLRDEIRVVTIDIRGIPGLLHLKSGLSYLGSTCLLVSQLLEGSSQFLDHSLFGDYRTIKAPIEESYASNVLLINDSLLFPSRFPLLEKTLSQSGYELITLEMSEFHKMDGGLSCLSLRF